MVNPKNTRIDNRNPKVGLIDNRNPKLRLIDNRDPKLNLINFQNFAYLETRTINKGQIMPWGLNWAITYPVTLTFNAVRL